jgi:hypothetical protein
MLVAVPWFGLNFITRWVIIVILLIFIKSKKELGFIFSPRAKGFKEAFGTIYLFLTVSTLAGNLINTAKTLK